jgi:hypothetical protein
LWLIALVAKFALGVAMVHFEMFAGGRNG